MLLYDIENRTARWHRRAAPDLPTEGARAPSRSGTPLGTMGATFIHGANIEGPST